MNKHTFLAALFVALLSTVAFAQPYIITGYDGAFTVAKSGVPVGSGAIQDVVDAIKADAGGVDCSIQFGDGTEELDIGTESITFDGGDSGTDWGEITLLGKITSAASYTDYIGTISLSNGVSVESRADIRATSGYAAISNPSYGTVTITSGTISASNGLAIYNSHNGTLIITGGTISGFSIAIGHYAIRNDGTLTITGGTILAFGSDGYAIFNYFSYGTLIITGGTISASGSMPAIYSSENGSIILGGSPDIIGRISVGTGILSVIASSDDIFSPGNKQYELELDSYSNGMIALKDGKEFLQNFTLYNPSYENAPGLEVNGNDLVMKLNLIYSVSSNGLSFAITKGNGGQFGTIQEAINSIKAEAGGADCSIQFGDGTAELDISGESITFDGGSSRTEWGEITLSGKITSAASRTVSLGNGVSVESEADIRNTESNGSAIVNSGTLTITGGTILATYNYAIFNSSGTLTITGGTISAFGNTAISNDNVYGTLILGGNPDITGRIKVYAGKLSVIASGGDVFNPGNKQYELEFDSYSNGIVAVKDGQDFLSNFKIYNPSYENDPSLEINGNDLIMKLSLVYSVSSNELYFTITKGNQFGTIREVIDFIKTSANGEDCSIQFGDGTTELDISGESVTFDGGSGNWGKIMLLGKITSAATEFSSTINLQIDSVESKADIRATSGYAAISNYGTLTITGGTISSSNWAISNLGTVIIVDGGVISSNSAISNSGGTLTISGGTISAIFAISNSGTLTISGGTISASYSNAINNSGTITITGGAISASYSYAINNYDVNGSLILGGSPDITGRISVYAGKLRIITSGNNVFNPSDEQYELEFESYSNGILAVKDGKDFLSNFTLTNNLGWGLAVSGNDLVTIPTYTVTFKNWNYATLKTQTINHGSAATAPEDPTRDGYTFIGWDIAFSNVTIDLTVTAEYTINTYTVAFADWNGTTLETQPVNHGFAATAPEDPTRDGYSFTGWDKAFSNVTGDLVVTAQYIKTYTVTFVDWNYEMLKTQTINHGSSATPPTAPTREGYTFTGWDIAFNKVTNDLTVTAEYTINSYTVTFAGWDGTVLKTQTVNQGSSAIAPTAPTRIGYTFTGWDKTFNNVTSNLTVTARYTIITYTVTFVDWDGTVLKTQTINHGSSATPPTAPTREGYTFTGWDIEFDNVTSNLTVTARYTIITYTVTFVGWDSTMLKTQPVNHGTAATAPTAPTRAGYTFTGWDAEFSNVTSNLTVRAQYEAETPILPQIATNNLLTQTRSGLNLTAKTNATIEVYNLNGKLISKQNYIAGSHSISFGHLPKGMYIVKATFGSEKQVLRVPVR